VAREAASQSKMTKEAISRRLRMGTNAMLGICVAIKKPTVEHMGQMCDADGVAFTSAQK
jgi:hypothetical protein